MREFRGYIDAADILCVSPIVLLKRRAASKLFVLYQI